MVVVLAGQLDVGVVEVEPEVVDVLRCFVTERLA